MDENETNEETRISPASAYAQLFATSLVVGTFIGIGIVAGGEAAQRGVEKLKKIRSDRAAKKTAEEK